MSRSERVSPTAYATGYFWYRHGLSHEGLVTEQGRRLDRAFRLLIKATRVASGISLDALMLARHRGIDARLALAIEEGRVGQVIEIAAGLSARGWRFMQRYGDRLTYIETDLSAMAATKQRLLKKAGLLSARHRVVELDALTDKGPQSLAAIAGTLDPKLGTAIITEGLMNYLPPDAAQGVWRRIGKTLRQFPHGLYLADAYLTPEQRSPAMVAFGAILSAFVRARMHVHFHSKEHAQTVMREAGFKSTEVLDARSMPENRDLADTAGADRVRILEART